jgi:hypothetical protein
VWSEREPGVVVVERESGARVAAPGRLPGAEVDRGPVIALRAARIRRACVRVDQPRPGGQLGDDGRRTNVSLNQFGTADPPPLGRVGLSAYLAYFDAALDEARERGVAREGVRDLLVRVLGATVDASGSA